MRFRNPLKKSRPNNLEAKAALIAERIVVLASNFGNEMGAAPAHARGEFCVGRICMSPRVEHMFFQMHLVNRSAAENCTREETAVFMEALFHSVARSLLGQIEGDMEAKNAYGLMFEEFRSYTATFWGYSDEAGETMRGGLYWEGAMRIAKSLGSEWDIFVISEVSAKLCLLEATLGTVPLLRA